MQSVYAQGEFDVKLEWGLDGVETLRSVSDVVIIVDVLSFSTCVDIATSRGAQIFPYPWKDASAIEFAASITAKLASHTRDSTSAYSLSPTSLVGIPAHSRLVLPSPNGSMLTLATGDTPTLCGSLRNARAVASHAQSLGRRVSVIAAGERWPNNSLRPAIEDLIGAGAIIASLTGSRSPESDSALCVFERFQTDLLNTIRSCSSGKELIERGFERDLELSCALNVSTCVPVFVDGAYRRYL